MNETKRVNPPEEIFYGVYEPKTKNRYICYLRGSDNNDLIPAYLLKQVQRPIVSRKVSKIFRSTKWVWHPINIELYDPITPSGSKSLMNYIQNHKPFTMIIRILDPAGSIIEEWELINAKITKVNFGDLNWEESNIPSTIKATIEYKNAKLNS